MSISMQWGWHVTSMWNLRCRGWLVARSIVAMPLLTIPSSTISETWPFRLLTISKLNWMSNFPVMSFRVKSLLNCSFSFYIPPHQLVHFFVPLKYWGSSFLRTDRSVLASSLLCLVPSVLCDRAGDLPNADGIINIYKDDLPSPELLRQEIFRFQIRWNIVN